MAEGEVWRREGLSVGTLAAEVGMPDHKLRVLINGRLGYRNFAAFINARRIDAVRFSREPATNIRTSTPTWRASSSPAP